MNNGRANRAAQFSPFDALKGLQEALREKEEKLSLTKKKELTEDQQAELSTSINKLERGKTIEVTFYDGKHYAIVTGRVVDLNVIYRFLVVNKVKVHFDDMYQIRFV